MLLTWAAPRLARDHGEGAGVGKQVEHLATRVSAHVFAHPAAALGHVQKQAMVLPLEHVYQIPRTVLGDHMGRGHTAGHQAGF